jgi:hypothetical protein
METVAGLLMCLSLLMLVMAKVELGNRDGNTVDAWIQQHRSAEEKEQGARLGMRFLLFGILGFILSLCLFYWS